MILYTSLGIVVFLLMLLSWRRDEGEEVTGTPMALTLPSQDVVDRIFSWEDLRYAQTLPKRIQNMFMRDRRRLAFLWIRQIRATTISLTRDHVRAVRRSSTLKLWRELQIAGSFLAILASCEVFTLIATTVGPVRAKLLISFVAARLHTLQAQLGHSYLPAMQGIG